MTEKFAWTDDQWVEQCIENSVVQILEWKRTGLGMAYQFNFSLVPPELVRRVAEGLMERLNLSTTAVEFGDQHIRVTRKNMKMDNKPNSDPWEHRSEKMKCATCMWYVPKGEGCIGRCRRRSPTMSGFPVVYPSDWCGDHKLNEG